MSWNIPFLYLYCHLTYSHAFVCCTLSKQSYQMKFQSRKKPSCCYVFGFWQSLSSEVILDNSKLPEGVEIEYKSQCKNGVVNDKDDGRKCSNISIGDEVGNTE